MPESLANTFGCMFIALVVDLICFGAGFLKKYNRFLSCVHIATFIVWVYEVLINQFRLFEKLDAMPRTALAFSGIGGTFSNLVNTEVRTFPSVSIITFQAGATAGCDLSITVVLCWILHHKQTGVRVYVSSNTSRDVLSLIILAINRGALTSLAAMFNRILVTCTQLVLGHILEGLISSSSRRWRWARLIAEVSAY
ncbi:hypothetical protein CPB85DRAFT_1254860 [Mucidula mucida]|nr:hypothetical protein CPB85DRAFT_1254860 [Mucidula mucida]